MTKNILLSGVGGQGTITAAKMLTFGLMEAGYDVKMSEIHGMSQRGGDVVSQVRYSKDKVFSPVIEKGTADIVVSFEEMEALRTLEYLKPDGAVVVNTERIPSMTVLTGAEEYADQIRELKDFEQVLVQMASQRLSIDLDDGVRVNYPKFYPLVEPIKGLDKE